MRKILITGNGRKPTLKELIANKKLKEIQQFISYAEREGATDRDTLERLFKFAEHYVKDFI